MASRSQVRKSATTLSIYVVILFVHVGVLACGLAGSCSGDLALMGWLLASGWAVVELLWHSTSRPGVTLTAGVLAWGLGLSCCGVVFSQRWVGPPAGYDSTWHVVHAGFPFQGVVRLVQDQQEGVILAQLHQPPACEFGGNQDLMWWGINLTAFCILALLGQFALPLAARRYASALGIAFSVPAVLRALAFMYGTLPHA